MKKAELELKLLPHPPPLHVLLEAGRFLRLQQKKSPPLPWKFEALSLESFVKAGDLHHGQPRRVNWKSGLGEFGIGCVLLSAT